MELQRLNGHAFPLTLLQHYLIKKAELYLTIASQLPNPVPPDLPGLRGLPAAIWLRLSAHRLAAETLVELKSGLALTEGFHQARIAMLEGLIARAAGQKDLACALLDTALAEFERPGRAHVHAVIALPVKIPINRSFAAAIGIHSQPRAFDPKGNHSRTIAGML